MRMNYERRAVMPSTFAREMLRMDLYPQQAAIMDALATPGSRVTARTPNEAGKTSRIIAGVILWHLFMAPREGVEGGCITTSGSWNQVVNQLVPALKRYSNIPAFKDYEFQSECIRLRGIPQWIGFATNNPGAAQGFHGNVKQPLLAIIDEARDVPDQIIDTIVERCNPQRIGLFSNPGTAEGRFYESHSKDHTWTRFHLKPEDCPHISKESIQRRIERHGINSPLVRSMIFAEFMEQVEGGLISLAAVERCMAAGQRPKGVERRVFCDFSGGASENVIAFRAGNKVSIVDAWVEGNPEIGAQRFVKNFCRLEKEFGLKPEEIEGDADGPGGGNNGYIASIADLGWHIGHFHGACNPLFDDHCKNLISEVWHSGAAKIRDGEVILENDEVLRGQLINRKSKVDHNGKLCLEFKDEMKRRGVPSPDRADAVLGAIFPGQFRGNVNLTQPRQEVRDIHGWRQFEPQEDDENMMIPGAFAG